MHLESEVWGQVVSRWLSQAGARHCSCRSGSSSQYIIWAQGRAVLCPGHPERLGCTEEPVLGTRSGDPGGATAPGCAKSSLAPLTHRASACASPLGGNSLGLDGWGAQGPGQTPPPHLRTALAHSLPPSSLAATQARGHCTPFNGANEGFSVLWPSGSRLQPPPNSIPFSSWSLRG